MPTLDRVSRGTLHALLAGALGGAFAAWAQVLIVLPVLVLAVAICGPRAVAAGMPIYLGVAWLMYVDNPRPEWADRYGCGMDCIGFYEWPPEGARWFAAGALIGVAIWWRRQRPGPSQQRRPVTP